MTALADDASAVLTWLGRQKDVRRDSIAFFGVSQGGYVSLLAAARGARPDAIISVGAMMVSGAEQEIYRVGAETAADDVGPVARAAAVAYTREMLDRSRRGLAPMSPPSEDAPWRSYVFVPDSAEEAVSAWATDWSFDIRPHLKKVTAPVLAIYGANDRSSPIGLSLAGLSERLPSATCLQARVIPGSDHSLLRSRSGGRSEVPASPGVAPEAFPLISGWLAKRTCDPR